MKVEAFPVCIIQTCQLSLIQSNELEKGTGSSLFREKSGTQATALSEIQIQSEKE